ncbi:MAG: M15 family metallopeptidase [Acidimicrobiia bacterium]
MRFLALAFTLIFVLAPSPGAAAQTDDFPVYTGDQFKELYDYAVANYLPGLSQPTGQLPVTGDVALDDRIWEIAFARGYVLRPIASGNLASADGVPMQPQAAAAWSQLKAAARDAGLPFVVSSAYRSPATQRTQFLSKLQGTSDEAIDATLVWYSVPGTSKHHGGYALDFRYSNGTFGDFRNTPDYAWLSRDNFYNAKRFGFIPSYPDEVTAQGPNPEPWEFVWVGIDLIRCGSPVAASTIGPLRGPAAAIVAEVARCPGRVVPLGEAVDGLPTWWHRLA